MQGIPFTGQKTIPKVGDITNIISIVRYFHFYAFLYYFYSNNEFYLSAVRKYTKACRYLSSLRDAMGTTEDDEEEKIRAVEIPLKLNIAACHLASKNWDEAKKECENVIEVQESNSKALFRRGQALLGMNDFDGALKDLQKVRELQPDDKGVLNEIARAKKAKLDMVQKEKKLYSKMFK